MSDDTSIRILREIEDLKRRIARLERKEDGERIVARYRRDAAQTIDTTVITRIDYNVQVYDTHTAVTTGAAWVFTAPMSGYYDWTASIQWDGSTAWSSGDATALYLFINGAVITTLDRQDMLNSNGATTYPLLHGRDTAYMAAGSTGFIALYQDAIAPNHPTVTQSPSTVMFVTIERRNM